MLVDNQCRPLTVGYTLMAHMMSPLANHRLHKSDHASGSWAKQCSPATRLHCKLKIPVTSDVIIMDIIYIVGFITVHIYCKTSFESHTRFAIVCYDVNIANILGLVSVDNVRINLSNLIQ